MDATGSWWIVGAVVIVGFGNIPSYIGLFICYRRRRGKYISSPVKRKCRDASQKVPLQPVCDHHSDEEEADETSPMTEEGRNSNSTPHKETMIINEIKPHEKNNGQTPSAKTPVRGTTESSTDA